MWNIYLLDIFYFCIISLKKKLILLSKIEPFSIQWCVIYQNHHCLFFLKVNQSQAYKNIKNKSLCKTKPRSSQQPTLNLQTSTIQFDSITNAIQFVMT
mmetsp:Transcript_3015/g.4330  ORF Transcript_3015/g.4330 Transcript_3015/m.4330 type:complete len:98 (+) Transcript_3015:133-426(+)